MNSTNIDALAPMAASGPDNRRHIHYVDHVIQKRLLIALVVMECALVGLALWALYHSLGAIIEDNLYRIHLPEDARLLPRFLAEGTTIIAAIGVVNLLAIVAADRIWAIYVRGILRRLDGLIAAARQMDFTDRKVSCTHAVLEQAVAWRRHEMEKLRLLRAYIGALPAALPQSEASRTAIGRALAGIADAAGGSRAAE